MFLLCIMIIKQCHILILSVPGPQGEPGDGGMSMMMMLMGWIVVATALFLLRPNSLRGQRGDQKPNSNQVN